MHSIKLGLQKKYQMQSMINQKTQEWLINKATEWITRQRMEFLKNSRELDLHEKQNMKEYFESSTLESVRISAVELIENPPFYGEIQQMGINDLIDFNNMAGITFGECILLTKKLNDPNYSVLFHELVHVVQYEIMGIEKFATEYILGWLNNDFDYYKIPLEVQAYKLQSDYDKKTSPFSVKDFLIKELIV